MDFLQYQRDFLPQAKLEEAFIYRFDIPIDFPIYFLYRPEFRSYDQGLKQVRVSSSNVVLSPSTICHLCLY